MTKINAKPTVIFFGGPACKACKTVEPAIEEIVKTYPGLRFEKYCTEENADMAEEYEVTAVPTLFLEGEINGLVHRENIIGTMPKKVYEEKIAKLMEGK